MSEEDEEFGKVREKGEGFGRLKRPGGIVVPQQEQQAQQSPAPNIELSFDEKGQPVKPKRQLTSDEKEVIALVRLTKKWHDGLDLELTWNFFVMYLEDVIHGLVAFAPEMENIAKRQRRVEKRLGINVPEDEKIGMDKMLDAQKE